VVEGSEVVLPGVGLNPTRTGVIDALRAMGADIEVVDRDDSGVEPRGTLVVRSARLHGARIDGDLALRSLDELPVLSVAAAFAEGQTVIADAAELRVKESDRIARVATGLRAMGVQLEEQPDGLVIEGGQPHGPATVDASGDHRLAMSFTVAGLAGQGGVTLHAADAVASSWPGFYDAIDSLLEGSA
jgi:3-phosphoshikimate 1-carboxyvinyltransferase